MKITLNIKKKYFLPMISAILLLTAVLGVYAYQTGGPANYFGHSAEELEVELNDGTIVNLQIFINELNTKISTKAKCEWKSVTTAVSKANFPTDSGATGLCRWTSQSSFLYGDLMSRGDFPNIICASVDIAQTTTNFDYYSCM